jgi:hypothetical protein
MSFASMSAWQALLLMAGAGLAAWVLFRMKVRPPKIQVPTLLLWRRVFDQVREMTWWERVRRVVSMAATILIAVVLALAVTRPGPSTGATTQGRTLIVLDSSWSMAARTGNGETRWRRAVRQARAVAAGAGGDVALATTAEGLVEGPTSDIALIETALDRLSPAGGEDGAWPRVPGTDHVHFITDGASPRALDDGVSVHSVFEPAPNVAILAFGARAATAGAAAGEAYVQVANYASMPQPVTLSVTRGSTVVSSQKIDMAAGEAISTIVPLPPQGGARLLARVEAPTDSLPEDNEAVAWIHGAEIVPVTIVSPDPTALERVLRVDPSIRITVARPEIYQPPTEGIVVFDRWLPAEPPGRPALVIAPPASNWLGTRGEEERTARWLASSPHAVLSGVDPLTIDVKRVAGFSGDTLTAIARTERGTPLISVQDQRDRRLVLWSFAVADTNLANAPGFPVLLGNSIEWLARPYYGGVRKPGLVTLPPSTSRVVSPTGEQVPIVRAGSSAVVRLRSPGLYLVDAAGSRGVVGVNVGDPDVSNLSRSALGEGEATAVAAGGAGRPWWMWAIGLGFLLVAAEWWTWQRRVTV